MMKISDFLLYESQLISFLPFRRKAHPASPPPANHRKRRSLSLIPPPREGASIPSCGLVPCQESASLQRAPPTMPFSLPTRRRFFSLFRKPPLFLNGISAASLPPVPTPGYLLILVKYKDGAPSSLVSPAFVQNSDLPKIISSPPLPRAVKPLFLFNRVQCGPPSSL